MSAGWIGVDLDGTLAHYEGWTGGIGEPIPAMATRVRAWIEQGIDVRIFTARVGRTGLTSEVGTDNHDWASKQETLIQDWTEKHFRIRLPVTATKDFAMVQLWDDRAIQVEINTGRRIDGVCDYHCECCEGDCQEPYTCPHCNQLRPCGDGSHCRNCFKSNDPDFVGHMDGRR